MYIMRTVTKDFEGFMFLSKNVLKRYMNILSNETVADPRCPVGGRGPVRGAWTSDGGAFHRKCM